MSEAFIIFLQWPAMALTLTAAWLVASQRRRRRTIGFWVFIAANALWIVWGWHDHAYALIFLQFSLSILNIRGVFKNDPELAAKLDPSTSPTTASAPAPAGAE